ncbi:unnamed protein product [Hyaloperonospora brassicae]|uniref:Phospholipase/carboxylesterase/thioesterase domain-containing protein n=1 Tax=Hyaloperonospora brassicae TaxID=162125 RepID=A0AAV0TUJ5_HYABA|nr:unnamed protein product [Hyaloperonospora brassicae]
MDAAVERVHEAARLLLVRGPDGRTRWLSHASHDLPPLGISHAPSTPVTLRPKTTVSRRSNCLDLDALRFPDKRSVFRLVQPTDGAPEAQNLLLLLHGRGDSHETFARLGEHMALPQTAVVSLRAPLELPFGLGRSWVDDLDETGDVIPPTGHTSGAVRQAAQLQVPIRRLARIHEEAPLLRPCSKSLVMQTTSTRLRNIALENRSDVVEIQT